MLVTTNSFLYRRSAFNVIGLYREDLPVLGDWQAPLVTLTSTVLDSQEALKQLLLERHDFEIKMLSALFELLSIRLAERDAEAAALACELETVRASVNWRLTRPLRVLARPFRRG